jgi:hypothetical protein
MADGSTAGPAAAVAAGRAAPVKLRFVAFVVDLLLVAVVELLITWPAGVSPTLPALVVTFVAYHTALLWLTGTTVGKTMFYMRLERVDGRPFRRQPGGLLWVFLRVVMGYLVVDLVVVGAMTAVSRADRRPLHDVVFGSQVVLSMPVDWAAKRGLRGRAGRVERYGGEVEDALDEVRPSSRALGLGRWLLSAAAALQFLLGRLRAVGGWIARTVAPGPAAPAAAPTSLSAGQTAAVLAATLAVTAMTVNAAFVAGDPGLMAAVPSAVPAPGVVPTQPGEEEPTEAEYVQAFATSMNPQVTEYFSGDQRTCLARLYVKAAGGADGIWGGSIVTPGGIRFRTLMEVRVFGGVINLLRGDYFLGPEFPQDVARCVDLRQYAIRMSWDTGPESRIDGDCVSRLMDDAHAAYLLHILHGGPFDRTMSDEITAMQSQCLRPSIVDRSSETSTTL